jgi:3-methyladenine DNA glycosylase Mpg
MGKLSKTGLFHAAAAVVAQNLLGRPLQHYVAGQPLKARIIVTGAYEGLTGNRTQQEGMNAAPGELYIMRYRGYTSLNFGTESAGTPSVVCIAGIWLETQSGLELKIGPGRVTDALQIDERFNGISLDELPDLRITGRGSGQRRVTRVEAGVRIGTGQGANAVHYSSNCIGMYAIDDLRKRNV